MGNSIRIQRVKSFSYSVSFQVINKGGVAYKNMPWHRECFTCSNCSKELAKEKFTSKDDQPYCAECYGDMFAKKCCRCTKPITGTYTVLSVTEICLLRNVVDVQSLLLVCMLC